MISRRARLRLVGPEVVVCPSSGSTTWWPFGRCGSSSLRGVLRRRREVERAADQQRLDVRRPHAAVLVVVRVRRPRVGQAAAGPDEVGAGLPRIEPRSAAGREVARAAAGVLVPRGAPASPQTNDVGKASVGQQRQEPEAARVALRGRRASESIVIGAESGAAAGRSTPSGRRTTASRTLPLLDRQEPASGRGCPRPSRRIEAARSSVRARQLASCGAERGVAADLRVGRLAGPRGSGRAG